MKKALAVLALLPSLVFASEEEFPLEFHYLSASNVAVVCMSHMASLSTVAYERAGGKAAGIQASAPFAVLMQGWLERISEEEETEASLLRLARAASSGEASRVVAQARYCQKAGALHLASLTPPQRSELYGRAAETLKQRLGGAGAQR